MIESDASLQSEKYRKPTARNATSAAAVDSDSTYGSLTPFGLASISARTRARTFSVMEAVVWETWGVSTHEGMELESFGTDVGRT